jgi:pimeloyl-ACP methyl ester carboxylesterase
MLARDEGRTPVLLQLAVGVIVAYGGIVGVMYLTQRSLMYVPDSARVSPVAAGLPQAEEITLTTTDSERLVTWHVAPQSDRPVILYLQGNGGALRHRVHRFSQLVQDGFGLVAVSYRGFGGSTGSPSETGLLLDAAAGYAFCTERYAAERIVVWGESLGTGVAVALASEQPVGRLILEAPFTSAAEVAQLSYPLIPVSLLMKSGRMRGSARSRSRLWCCTASSTASFRSPSGSGFMRRSAPPSSSCASPMVNTRDSTPTVRLPRCATSWLWHPPISIDRHYEMAGASGLRWAGKDMGQWSVPRDSKTAARSTRVLDSGCSRLPK